MADELLTLSEIAKELWLNPSTVRLWVREERLPAQKIGRKWVVARADLEKMLDREPRLGHPRTGLVKAASPTDWSQVPEQATLNLASSAQVTRRTQ